MIPNLCVWEWTTKKKEKTSSIAVDEPCLHVLTNNNNNLRNEKKQETKEKTQNDSLAFVTTFLEWLFFSTATTYYYYYLQTKTNIVVPHTIISRGFSLSLSIQFFLPLYGGSRRINACIIVLYKVVVQKLVANRSSSLVCTMLLLLLHYTLYIYIYIYTVASSAIGLNHGPTGRKKDVKSLEIKKRGVCVAGSAFRQRHTLYSSAHLIWSLVADNDLFSLYCLFFSLSLTHFIQKNS